MMTPATPIGQGTGTGTGPAAATVAPVGLHWDAVRVPRHIGLAVLERLTGQVGAVLVAPYERAMYFFLPPGTCAGWELEPTRAFGETAYLLLPPPDRRTPPGPYWLHSPADRPFTASFAAMRDALRDAVNAAYGPRPAVLR